jgi:hypothetical protein
LEELMSFKRPVIVSALLLGLVALWGCSDNSVKPAAQASGEEAVLTGTLAVLPEFVDDGLFDAPDQTLLSPSLRGVSGAAAVPAQAIEPSFFWRSITARSRTFEFAFADSDSTGLPTTAIVTLHRRFTGTFNIVPRGPSDVAAADRSAVIAKPLHDHWVRRFLMKRVRVGEESRARWRLAAASAVEVTSSEATSDIESIRVQTATKDTTLTDPLAFIFLRRVLRFASEDSVTLTVSTPRADDVVLLYHHDLRARFRNNGDGTYTAKFRAGIRDGWRHFGVNVLSHGTLFDDAAPYDSKAWIFPYVMLGGPNVEYLP